MSGRRWTKAETQYIEEAWGKKSIPTIAKHLGRSVTAVRIKAVRLKLRRHIHSGEKITLYQLFKALGKNGSYSWYKQKWIDTGLPVKYQKSIKKHYAMVDIDDFWEWAKKHKHLIDFSALEENVLGIEPNWVKEARNISYSQRMRNSKWTTQEDDRLRAMLKTYRYTYDDLCLELKRSESAIKRRILTLGLTERPLPHESRPWQDNEVKTLLSMKAAGYNWTTIGKHLSRSGLAVQGKYERLINSEYHTGKKVDTSV